MPGRTGRSSRKGAGMSRAVRNATELSSAISSDDAACGADSDEEFRRPVASRKGNRQKRKRQASVPPDSSSKGCGNSASESSTGDADAWSEGSKEASDEMSSEDREPLPARRQLPRGTSNARAGCAASAGDAFRARLAARKPAATASALEQAEGAAQRGGARRAVEVQSSSEDSELRLRRHQEDAPIQDFIARDSDATSASEGPHPGAAYEPLEPQLPSCDEDTEEQRPAKKRRNRRGKADRGARPSAAQPASAPPLPNPGGAAVGADAAAAGAPGSTTLRQRRRVLDLGSSDDEAAPPPRSVAAAAGSTVPGASPPGLERKFSLAATPGSSARKRHLVKAEDISDSDGDDFAAVARMSRRAFSSARTPQYPPEQQQRTVTSFFTPQSPPGPSPVAAAASKAELEDSGVETPCSSLEPDSVGDFIVEDEEEGGGESDSEGSPDPIPAALQRLRDKLGEDNTLAEPFAAFCCGLLHEMMGAPMDGQLSRISEDGRWRVRAALEMGSNEVGGNLGWVNAERNGVIDAIRTLTHNECARDEDQTGGSGDEEAEQEDRDGRFTCEVCGRSDPLRSLKLMGRCSSDSHRTRGIPLHSPSPGKGRRSHRRRPGSSDDEGSEQDEGQGEEARGPCGSRKAQRTLPEAYGYDSFAGPRSPTRREGEVTFWVGSGCALRVMLSQLAWHWTCLFADKLRSISMSPSKAARLEDSGDLKPAVAEEMDARGKFFGFWFGRLRQVLGLAKKVKTMPRNKALQGVGAEVRRYYNEFVLGRYD